MTKHMILAVVVAVMAVSSTAKAEEVELGYVAPEVVVAASGTNYEVHEVVSPEVYESSTHFQETSPGQESPFIGPFTGNMVDQSLNGVRVSNSLYRTGPNQYYGWVPTEFVKSVSIMDGGNIGGTIERELEVDDSHIGMKYDSSNKGLTETAAFKNDKFGIGLMNEKTDNIDTADGEVPHSSFNKYGVIGEYNWNDQHKTILMFTKSTDLERTDTWNGGTTIDRVKKSKVYTWELQQYTFINHSYDGESLDVDLAYQNFKENILDGTTKVRTQDDVFNINVVYNVTDNITLYSTNMLEQIDYDNGKGDPVAHDGYNTYKQGVRYHNSIGGIDVMVSAGYKEVKTDGFDSFNSPEGSLILGHKGFFVSGDYTTNAPGYTMLNQALTTGKGVNLPNPDLKMEKATTYRIGYKKGGVYVDAYRKQLNDALSVVNLGKDVYTIYNTTEARVYGSTVAYQVKDVWCTGIDVDSRFEFTYDETDVYNSDEVEPLSKTAPFTAYMKASHNRLFTEWLYAPKDGRQSSNDLSDVRIYEHNDGYNVVNFGYEGSHKHLDYSLVLQNAFDNDGRVLGSSVDVPGRSIVTSIAYRF